jgi:hypothetical protein
MNIDIIGTIYNNDAVIDAEGNITSPATPVDGYHVNTTELPESLKPYQVIPSSPQCVFGGHVTYHLKFADEAEFKSVMAEWLPVEMKPVEEFEGELV